MPVPGTMSSVNWVDLQDPTLYFGIPVVGFKTAEGYYLENHQLEPDVKVANSPEDMAAGIDNQLRVAVETLLRDIDK
jgi:C-terminal processing protease CtpA/Prc